MNLFSPPKYAQGDLTGLNGNAVVLIGYFKKQAKRANWTDSEIELVVKAAKSVDYDHLVSVIMSHLESDSE